MTDSPRSLTPFVHRIRPVFHRWRGTAVAALCLVALLSTSTFGQDGEPENPSALKLAGAGVEPTVAGVSAYLKSQIPSEAAKKEAATQIKDLGSAEFLERERAERFLLSSANPPVEALEAAAADKTNPDIAIRAARILKTVKSRPRTTLHSALRWVASSPDPSFVPTLLQLTEFGEGSVERSLLSRALANSVGDGDLDILKKALSHPLAQVRTAALVALGMLEGGEASDAIAKLTMDPDDSVKLAAATALANRSDRRCLVPLGRLLESEVTATRMRAHHLLMGATARKFEFSAYASEEDRGAAAKKIQAWIDNEGAKVKLISSEERPAEAVYVGRTVVANWPSNFNHYDTDGKLIFSAPGFTYVWGCHGTAEGEFAVVDAKKKTAKIYDAGGKAVWVKDDLPGEPSDIKILPGGNRLITLSSPSRVIELDPEGNTIWKIDFPGRTRSTVAQRLSNGNTLVNLQFGKKVVEVNPEGETVWELPGLKNCLTAQALPNGNVLVCEMSEAKAIEYNREGEVVWEKGGFQNACQAQRLPNGNTLVSDKEGIHEIDPEGNEVHLLSVKRGRFWRY